MPSLSMIPSSTVRVMTSSSIHAYNTVSIAVDYQVDRKDWWSLFVVPAGAVDYSVNYGSKWACYNYLSGTVRINL